ncbi:hypothetical protein [Streptomyces sp. 142MFCol3.1]|uniref:hypothetical protein n=1 Tax=Streptomyces sp. 142MFCol3.1 TaxID=1172179 RepID=UPI00042582F6|nr:hypothetical protein [Streptomyces sp. 142MFCol3.1]
MVMNVCGLLGWAGGWIALIGISTYTPNWVVWIFMPHFIYGFYRVFVQLTYFPWALRMRRVLRVYPWQVLKGVPSGIGKYPGARDDGIWFEFRSPADPGEKIPMVFIRHTRSYWWLRRMDGPRTNSVRRAQIEPLWFAGDPRYLAVIAAPGRGGRTPKRFHVLHQRPVFDRRCEPGNWTVDAADVELARRAGVPDPGAAVHSGVTGSAGNR